MKFRWSWGGKKPARKKSVLMETVERTDATATEILEILRRRPPYYYEGEFIPPEAPPEGGEESAPPTQWGLPVRSSSMEWNPDAPGGWSPTMSNLSPADPGGRPEVPYYVPPAGYNAPDAGALKWEGASNFPGGGGMQGEGGGFSGFEAFESFGEG